MQVFCIHDCILCNLSFYVSNMFSSKTKHFYAMHFLHSKLKLTLQGESNKNFEELLQAFVFNFSYKNIFDFGIIIYI